MRIGDRVASRPQVLPPSIPRSGPLSVRSATPLVVVCTFVLAVGAWMATRAADLTFLGDDTWLIQSVAEGNVWGDYSGFGTQFLRPLPSVVLWVQYQVFGADPAGYHVVSVVIHLANSLLVAVLAATTTRTIGRSTGSAWLEDHARAAGLLGGLAFLLHPSHGEAVYWIGAQSDLLATAFTLLAFIALLRSVDDGRPLRSADGGRPLRQADGGRPWRVAAFVAIALALLCKESAFGALLALGFVAVVLGRWADPASRPPETRGISALRPAIPYALVGLGYVALRWMILGTPVGGYGPDAYLGQRFGRVLAHAATVTARSVLPAMPVPALVISVTIGFTIATVIWMRWLNDPRRRTLRRALLVLAAVIALVLVPVAPLGVSAVGALGERYVYMASAFVCILLAVTCVLVARRVPTAAIGGAGLLIVVALGAIGIREANRWGDASIAAQHVTASLRDVGTTEALLLNVPDTVRGAVAFRNSAVGLGVYRPTFASTDVSTVTTRMFNTPGEIDSVDLLDNGRTVRVTVSDPPPGGPTNQSESATGAWEVTITGDDTYEVTFADGLDPESVLFFSGGELHEVE